MPATSKIQRPDDVADTGKGGVEREIEHPLRSEYKSIVEGLSLCGLSVGQLASHVWAAAIHDEIFDRAAELAYYFLFALFPALIFLSAMFGLFASTQTKSNIELMLYLGKLIPPSAFAMVESAFTATTSATKTGNLAFGAIVALWSATIGMSSVQTVLNAVYRRKETRPYWKAKAIAILLTLAMFVLVFTAMLLLLVGDYLTQLFVNDWFFHRSSLIMLKVGQVVVALFCILMVFALTYYWGPDRKRHTWRWISPGSIVGICGWLVVSLGFRLYLHFFDHYAVLYGSVGTVIILLTWFYVSGLMLLLGAEINASLERSSQTPLLPG